MMEQLLVILASIPAIITSGFLALIVLGVVVVAVIYTSAVLRPATGGATAGGGLSTNWILVGVTLAALAIGLFIFDNLWVVATGLMVGGRYLLWHNKLPNLGGALVGIGALLAVFLYIFGGDAIEYKREQWRAVATGQEAPPPPPLSDEEQAARMERERQEAEMARVRAVAEAAALAEAEEADRLARQVTSQLPASIRVPHCNNGWSQPVIIPGGWRVRSSWTGRVTRTQYLNEGTWRDVTTLTVSVPVEAFRYCTTSRFQ